MPTNLIRSVTFSVIALLLTFAFTFAGVGVSQLFFRHQADGSITATGSTLIGQNWADASCPGHPLGSCVFHGRPDDTGPYAAVVCAPSAKNCTPASGGDNPLVANGADGESAATNLGPRSKVLLANTEALIAYWHKLGVNPTTDLVTTSGSGYDPDITAADALVQVPMVAKATGISSSALQHLIAEENHSAQLGFLGSSYIDVLQLNEALAKLR
jgi:K+-transporting ATPase ATPase C chain